jgi:hypothetical protein
LAAKKSPTACDGRALKAKSKNVHALYSAPPSESQTQIETLRERRLARAGLSLAQAAIVAPLAFGEARQ